MNDYDDKPDVLGPATCTVIEKKEPYNDPETGEEKRKNYVLDTTSADGAPEKILISPKGQGKDKASRIKAGGTYKITWVMLGGEGRQNPYLQTAEQVGTVPYDVMTPMDGQAGRPLPMSEREKQVRMQVGNALNCGTRLTQDKMQLKAAAKWVLGVGEELVEELLAASEPAPTPEPDSTTGAANDSLDEPYYGEEEENRQGTPTDDIPF